MFQSIPPEEYIPKDSNDVGASVKLFNHYGETFAEVDKGGNIMALMRLMDSTASIYKDIALVIFFLLLFQIYMSLYDIPYYPLMARSTRYNIM